MLVARLQNAIEVARIQNEPRFHRLVTFYTILPECQVCLTSFANITRKNIYGEVIV